MENFNSKNIHLVSYGIPGSLDFEIPKKISKITGVKHELINLSPDKFEWSYDLLYNFAIKKNKAIVIFESYINNYIPLIFGKDFVYWSGFMGDPISGSHLPEKINLSYEESVNLFIKNNNYSKIKNKEIFFDIKKELPSEPLLSNNILTYYEQLDFIIRQNGYLRRAIFNEDFIYKTPFLQPRLVSFFLNLPYVYRKGQTLYKDILKKMYPRLFSIKTKTNFNTSLFDSSLCFYYGKNKIRTINFLNNFFKKNIFIPPMLNYSNFDEDLRNDNNLSNIVFRNINDLEKRKIVNFIDTNILWKNHQQRKESLSSLLMLLASLEINIKAGNIKL